MIAFLAPLALAGSGDFPLRAEVSCPEQGVCRVLVPPQMSATGAALLLEDDEGRPVPNARLPALEAPDRWRSVNVADNGDRGVRLDVAPPIGAVRLILASDRPGLALLRLRTRRNAGQEWWTGEAVRLDPEDAPAVLAVPDPEALHVELVGPTPEQVSAEVGVLGAVREVSGTVEVFENWAVVTLAEPAALRRLTLPGAPDGNVNLFSWLDENGAVIPQYLGTYPCQDGVVLGVEATGRRFAVEMPAPAAVSVARGWAPRDVLLVRDAGAMTLYGGADGDSIAGLQGAAADLLALPWTGATVGLSQPNPDHSGGLSLLLSPAAPIEEARFRFSRALSGTGLVRIPLPAPLLLQVRRDLRDLRVLDAEGRQLPYAIVEDVGEELVEPVSVAVEERAGQTRVKVLLPRDNTGPAVLTLSTPARGFSRSVTVRSGRETVTRAWKGQGELRIALKGPLGRDITATIDNGDDPALPVTVEMAVPRRSLLARVGEGSRLVYGDRSVLPEDRGARLGRRKRKRIEPIPVPRYDLRQHGAAILGQAEGAARVGPEQSVLQSGEGPEQQRILIATMIAALVMVGVLGRVLLSARPSAPDRDEGGGSA